MTYFETAMENEPNVYSICKNIEQATGVRTLSLEFEIMLELFISGALSSGEIVDKIHASQASFSIISRRLRQRGLVVAQVSEGDKRKVIYSISEKARGAILGSSSFKNMKQNEISTLCD
jgi:DNA-binding MarR family transcriptional regulator